MLILIPPSTSWYYSHWVSKMKHHILDMKIAVVIPTYKYHIPFLKQTLESIAGQTRIPDLVVVRASSCDDETVPLLNDIRKDIWPFHLNILETTAKQFTGQNRNDY